MSWEVRGNRRYYFRVERVNGRLRKQYLGNGQEAEEAAARDEAVRRARQQEQEAIRAIEEAVSPVSALMRELETGSQLLMHGTLLAAGFHQHRGNWRRRRA